jgi:hypothetical protein
MSVENTNTNTNTNTSGIDVTFKVYPTTYKNSLGFYIGKYAIDMKSVNPSVTIGDEVNKYMIDLISSINNDLKNGSNKLMNIPVVTRTTKFFPQRYKGGKKNTRKKGKSSKRKSGKRKNKKN